MPSCWWQRGIWGRSRFLPPNPPARYSWRWRARSGEAWRSGVLTPLPPLPKGEGGRESLSQVSVGFFEPVLARRIENVDVERILERVGLVGHVARQMEHLARAHHDLLRAIVPDEELQRTFQDVGKLLVHV